MPHAINWFDIPAIDLKRARTFYETVFGIRMFVPEGPMKTAFFPADWEQGEVGGGIIEGEGFAPSDAGSVVYLNGGDDLSVALGRVEGAGGKVLQPKTEIPMAGAGFFAMFLDTEGNKIGLHSVG